MHSASEEARISRRGKLLYAKSEAESKKRSTLVDIGISFSSPKGKRKWKISADLHLL